MKYVVFKRNQLLLPVIVPEHCSHAGIQIEGFTPISAGFFSIEMYKIHMTKDNRRLPFCEIVLSDQISESLRIGPREEDKRLIEDMLINSGMYAFLSF